MKKKILITGSNSFVGYELIKYFLFGNCIVGKLEYMDNNIMIVWTYTKKRSVLEYYITDF